MVGLFMQNYQGNYKNLIRTKICTYHFRMQGQHLKNQYYLYMVSNCHDEAKIEKEKLMSFTKESNTTGNGIKIMKYR